MQRRLMGATAAALALAVMAAVLAWSVAGLAAEARSPGPASFDALLGLMAAGCAAAAGAWLGLAAVLTVVGSLPGALAKTVDDVARRIAPRAMRRAIQFAIGATLMTGPISGSSAWADETSIARLPAAAQLDAQAGLPAIDRPAPDPAVLPPIDRPAASSGQTTWTPTAPPPPEQVAPPASPLLTGNPRPTATAEKAIVVRRGDTLWHIASRHLGPAGTAAEIAAEWPRWWNANRDVIGDDPNLIFPGQVLHPPP